jgi:hypothetical protein
MILDFSYRKRRLWQYIIAGLPFSIENRSATLVVTPQGLAGLKRREDHLYWPMVSQIPGRTQSPFTLCGIPSV